MIRIHAENLSKAFNIHHGGGMQSFKEWGERLFSKNKKIESDERYLSLNKVSFTVKSGQALGIIGSNGSGKSTLLKILSRVTEPSEGRVTITGKMASLLEVGTGFHPELTGRENVFLNGIILGLSRAEIKAKFDNILDFSEIAGFIDTPVKHYSSGMYVKLAFAVATAVNPDILIVDEVLAVGDKQFQDKCLAYMQNFIKQGGTLLFVSHDQSLVEKLCTDILWLEKGVKQQTAENPQQTFTLYNERNSSKC